MESNEDGAKMEPNKDGAKQRRSQTKTKPNQDGAPTFATKKGCGVRRTMATPVYGHSLHPVLAYEFLGETLPSREDCPDMV